MTPPIVHADADRFRNALAFFLISAFVGSLPMLIFKDIPETNKEIIVYMVGQLSDMATMALGFYFTQKAGADAADAKRAENTGKMADAVIAAANASTSSAAITGAADAVADAAADKANQIGEGKSNGN